MPLKFNLDPPPWKAIFIGVLLFAEALLMPIIVITQQGTMPTDIQMVTIVCTSLLQLVTYFLVFLGFKQSET